MDRLVSTGRPPTQTELELAEVIGMKKDGSYLHWEAVLDPSLTKMTTFTQPPHFSTDPAWSPILKRIAREKFGIELIAPDEFPENVSKEFLVKLKGAEVILQNNTTGEVMIHGSFLDFGARPGRKE